MESVRGGVPSVGACFVAVLSFTKTMKLYVYVSLCTSMKYNKPITVDLVELKSTYTKECKNLRIIL